MKKAITIVSAFHVLCYALMLAGSAFKNGLMIGLAFALDIVGAVLCPIALSLMALMCSMRDENLRVIKLYPQCASTIGAIGLVRGILFFFVSASSGLKAGGSAFVGAMKYLVISFLLLTVWFIIFELSSGTLKKNTKFNNRLKK